VCATCVERAVDDAGRGLAFFNTSLLGGFGVSFADTGEVIDAAGDARACTIDGIRCVSREARFGGVVVQPSPDNDIGQERRRASMRRRRSE
jgi:hypothetical protein